MTTKPSLVVLAAGLGSRYGSLKQIDGLGANRETILDYTLFDAIHAGFEKVVFVIRKSIETEFRSTLLNKLKNRIQVEYVFQEIDDLPNGFTLPAEREKPWGTAHAVLATEKVIKEPFAIVNADDFYGRDSLIAIYQQLQRLDLESMSACMIGFQLKNTLSEHGHVSRGICDLSPQRHLLSIKERTHIFNEKDANPYYVDQGKKHLLTGSEIVSMNLMGFTPAVFELMNEMFANFLESYGNELKSEFFIPDVLGEIQKRGAKAPVITSKEEWFGVTYKEDKAVAKLKLSTLIKNKVYPNPLWE